MPLFYTDYDILLNILEKESLFFKEIQQLSLCLKSIDLSDYINGLHDLKSDFIIPARNHILSHEKTRFDTTFSDRYWYYERT